MTPALINEIKSIISTYNLDCDIDTFKDKVNWKYISYKEKLSLEFIREFKDYVYWYHITQWQLKSEEEYLEFIDYIDFLGIHVSYCSENFLRKYSYKIFMHTVSWNRKR